MIQLCKDYPCSTFHWGQGHVYQSSKKYKAKRNPKLWSVFKALSYLLHSQSSTITNSLGSGLLKGGIKGKNNVGEQATSQDAARRMPFFTARMRLALPGALRCWKQNYLSQYISAPIASQKALGLLLTTTGDPKEFLTWCKLFLGRRLSFFSMLLYTLLYQTNRKLQWINAPRGDGWQLN